MMNSKPSTMTAVQDARVRLDDLSLGFGRESADAVSGLTLALAAGETVAIVGPTGSGKSALLRFLAGREPMPTVTGGDARIGEDWLRRVSRRGRARLAERVGYLGQSDRSFIPAGTSVAEMLAEPLRRAHPELALSEIGMRVAQALDAARLPLAALDAFATELSGGQQQRLLLVRTTLARPRVILWDEPSAGLDPGVRRVVPELLAAARAAHDTSALVVCHDARFLRDHADRILVLDHGRVAGVGTFAQLRAGAPIPFFEELCAVQADGTPGL